MKLRHNRWMEAALLGVLAMAIHAQAAEPKADEKVDPQQIRKDVKESVQETKSEKGPPLPLHSIEGTGGIFATHTAYLVNPPKKGDIVGLPAIETTGVVIGDGRYLTALTVTENLGGRVELGYGWEHMGLGDLRNDIRKATDIRIGDNSVNLHNFNARGLLVKDGDFKKPWVPAVTLGVHLKYNDTTDEINKDLGNTLHNIGVTHNTGVDFTLYTTKLIKALPRPILVSAGARASQAAHLGLLGFTDEYRFTAEGNVGLFVTDHFILAGEYRQKRSDYKPIPHLVEKERDWWTVDVAYLVTKRFTAGAGYGHFAEVLNHRANGAWGLKFKYEF